MRTLYIIHRGERPNPVLFGHTMLEQAAASKGAKTEYLPFWDGKDGETVLTGSVSSRFIQIVLERNGIKMDLKPEGVLLARCSDDRGGMITVAAGTDARGAMYAMCELAARIRDKGLGALEKIRTEMEYPVLPTRVAGRFIQSERDDSWYFSRDFWEYYIQRLAVSRINRFHLITGMDSAYMSPPYPFLVKTPGYEDVIGVAGADPEERRQKCLEYLKYIGRTCHCYGVEFCLGIWQQKPWTQNQKSLVKNSPEGDAFADYARKSLAELLAQCPEIDVISFRVNLEAGVTGDSGDESNTAVDFWNGMIDVVRDTGRDIKLDLRAKGLTDSMLERALRTGLDVTVPTKAWCEHVGLPYQTLQLRTEERMRPDDLNSSRRYSYDNLMKSPRSYDLQYRLWNYGTTNILLWGDPYYASRFIKSCVSAQASGFEFTAPLSMKGGHAMIPGGDWPIHAHPDMITYEFEDERYWMWYLLFGRLGYNPDADREIWWREMRARFGSGAVAADMEAAYLASGGILPLVTTAHFPEHPSMHNWPELYSGAALFAKNNYEPYFKKERNPMRIDRDYAGSLPSDEALFCSIARYVDGELKGEIPECYSPLEVRDWYKAEADATRAAVESLKANPAAMKLPEVVASIIDFTMLANIGDFHAWKTGAAYHLYRFEKTGEKADLKAAYAGMYMARQAWADLSVLGSKYYARNLEFDAGTSLVRNGNWQDRLEKEVDVDLKELGELLVKQGLDPKELEKEHVFESMLKRSPSRVTFTDDVPTEWPAGKNLTVSLEAGFPAGIRNAPVMRYRRANLREGEFIRVPMTREGNRYTAVIPGDYLTPDYDVYAYFTCEDAAGNALIHPGAYDARHILPVRIIKVVLK